MEIEPHHVGFTPTVNTDEVGAVCVPVKSALVAPAFVLFKY
jgi:hypothetical protein